MSYKEKLKYIIKSKNSNLIIGLDTDIEKIPEIFLKCKDPLYEFNKLIIKSTSDISVGYKFNMAFYEVMEDRGFEVIKESLKLIPDSCITICDAKRGDIPNSNEMYAKIYFDSLKFDAITLSPYMGIDTFVPFLERENKFVYVLALTSNKGSDDFQKLKIGNKYLYEIVIQKCVKIFGCDKIGFVFGANHINEIRIYTKKYPDLSMLVPGIGAQGNDLKKLLKNIQNNLFLINSSRGILYCSNKTDSFQDCQAKVLKQAVLLKNMINIRRF
jgi:orotidine-5'-phosphate decarboxylase